jgi:hypothetical protein
MRCNFLLRASAQSSRLSPSVGMKFLLFAYVDPGLGSLIWQSIVAAVVGFIFYLKKTRIWLAGLFKKIFRL